MLFKEFLRSKYFVVNVCLCMSLAIFSICILVGYPIIQRNELVEQYRSVSELLVQQKSFNAFINNLKKVKHDLISEMPNQISGDGFYDASPTDISGYMNGLLKDNEMEVINLYPSIRSDYNNRKVIVLRFTARGEFLKLQNVLLAISSISINKDLISLIIEADGDKVLIECEIEFYIAELDSKTGTGLKAGA